MKVLFTIFCTLTALFSFSQSTFQSFLDSGKKEYRYQYDQYESNYSKAYSLFQEAVKLQPTNTEARYFFGYAIDKVNAQTGAELNQSKLALTLLASEQFEYIIQQEPNYKGEILVLDPYAKLSAIWGSLALSYLNQNQKDSAVWALKEGKKRGGFINPLLEYNRQMLASCNPNAVLLSIGDNIIFPIMYLQLVEGYRTDVSLLDQNLLHSEWYPKYLKRCGIKISYSDQEIDSLSYKKWKPTHIKIENKQKKGEAISWVLKPTYQQDYILRGDLLLLNIIKNNFFKREFYFSFFVMNDTSLNLFMDEFITNDGTVSRIQVRKNIELPRLSISKNFKKYSIENVREEEIHYSQDAQFIWNTVRAAYIMNINGLYQKGQVKEAEALYGEMNKRLPLEKLPLYNDYFKEIYEDVTGIIKEGQPLIRAIDKN